VQRFTELLVWQRSHALTLEMYRLTANFPNSERFGLISQMRRAVLSVPTNIAEGSKRVGNPDFARFLNIAEGSLVETESLLMVSRDLGFVSREQCASHLNEIAQIAKMLHGLRSKVEKGPRLSKKL
jgi:four helix bundle protein